MDVPLDDKASPKWMRTVPKEISEDLCVLEYSTKINFVLKFQYLRILLKELVSAKGKYILNFISVPSKREMNLLQKMRMKKII